MLKKTIIKVSVLMTSIMIAVAFAGCTFIEVNTGNDEIEKYEITYHGDKYYGSEDFIWYLEGSRFIGFTKSENGLVYVSKGTDKGKFIEVWSFSNYHLRGYGTFIREDIEIAPPSSENINDITFSSDVEAEEKIKEGVLKVFDSYNNEEIKGVSIVEMFNKYPHTEIVSFDCSHSEYSLRMYATLYSIEHNYYLYIWNTSILIPISDELGEMISKHQIN